MITKKEILVFQEKWGKGIVSLSQTFNSNGDYINEAIDFIKMLYAYEHEEVLFKPTLASERQFRLNISSALSYFVGGNPDFSEDSGFAIKGWENVRWENAGIKIENNCAICMGNYFFSMKGEEDLKVEYSLVFKKFADNLKLILHDSHLPYKR